ncbi:MAG TPA: GTP cyclohydrolase I FolE, partial [Flavobacteriaceae bacterium]|nr:GTP cyclohydrolase I FolE [Flavobacteriaceae bacterium]
MNESFNIDTLPITDEIKRNFSKIIDLLGEDTAREG